MRAQLPIGVFQVYADRADADAEFLGNLLTTVARAEMMQGRLLPLRQKNRFHFFAHTQLPLLNEGIKYLFFNEINKILT
jgi:hypothetical protein